MIGEIVKFKDYCNEIFTSKVVNILSDKYDNVKFLDENVVYWSKKAKDYRKIKEKDKNSLYLEVESTRGKTDFIALHEIIP
tara:strand:+ start:239 stop:481 length:243 start_codon:yes stop_codon:yes gene_type:complete